MISSAESDPRRPFLIVSPRRLTQVGSPTMQKSMVSLRALSASTTRTVPSTASPSSSEVSSRASEFSSRARENSALVARRPIRRSSATTQAAIELFMSAAPRPYRWPSRIGRFEGRRRPFFQRSGGHHIGVPGKADQSPGRAASRPEIRDAADINTLDAESQRRQPVGNQVETAGIVRRHRRAGDQRLNFFEHRHQASMSSLKSLKDPGATDLV